MVTSQHSESAASTMQPMSLPPRCLAALAVLLGLVACGGPQEARSLGELDFGEDLLEAERRVVRSASALEILALDPAWPMSQEAREDPANFHGHKVLGRATLADSAVMLDLLNLIARSYRANDTTVAACFSPRHGVRVREAGSIVDLQICFECLQMKVFRDGERVHSGLMASTYEPLVSKIYRSAGLALAYD